MTHYHRVKLHGLKSSIKSWGQPPPPAKYHRVNADVRWLSVQSHHLYALPTARGKAAQPPSLSAHT